MEVNLVKIIIGFLLLSFVQCQKKQTYQDLDVGQMIITDSVPCMTKIVESLFDTDGESDISKLILITVLQTPKLSQRLILADLFDNEAYFMNFMIKKSNVYHRDADIFRGLAQGYLFLLSRAKEILSDIKLLKSLPSWNPNAMSVIMILEHLTNQTELDLELKTIFNITFAEGMIDVTICYMTVDNQDLVQTVTWFPYEGKECGRNVGTIRMVKECEFIDEDYRFKSYFEHLFPKIPNRFHECPIKITAVTNEPYVSDMSIVKKNGAEYNLIAAMANRFQLDPVFKTLPDSFGMRAYTDDPKNGFYSDILKGDADLMIGGLYESQTSIKILTSSVPYYQDDYTWCVQKSGIKEKWKNVFIIFDLYMWAATICTIFIASLILNLMIKLDVNRNENFAWSFLIIISFVTNNQTEFWPKRLCLRVFVVAVCFFAINIYSAYRSSLINVLTNPAYEYQVGTVEELINLDYTLVGGEHILELLSANSDEHSKTMVSIFKTVTNLDDALMELKNNSRLAVAVPRQRKANTHLPLTDYDISCFETSHNIYTYPIVILAKKHYHLMSKINDMIWDIAQNGFLTKFRKDSYRLIQNDGDLIDEKKLESSTDQPALTLDHVQGAFYLCLIGFALSFVVFLLEWIFFLLSQNFEWFRIFIAKYFCFTHGPQRYNRDL